MDEAGQRSTLRQVGKLYNAALGRLAVKRPCYLCDLLTTDLICQSCDADLVGDPPRIQQKTIANIDLAVATVSYRFPLDRIIQRAKFQRDLAALSLCGALLTKVSAHLQGVEAIIPIPLSRRRFFLRGYNQAVEIARPLARQLDLPLLVNQLHRSRHTRPQSDLDQQARRQNVAGCFECCRDFTGRHVLLVDDVMTTGATAAEAARALRQAGARQVSLCCVAMVSRP